MRVHRGARKRLFFVSSPRDRQRRRQGASLAAHRPREEKIDHVSSFDVFACIFLVELRLGGWLGIEKKRLYIYLEEIIIYDYAALDLPAAAPAATAPTPSPPPPACFLLSPPPRTGNALPSSSHAAMYQCGR